MIYALVEGTPTLATATGQRAACPGCGAEMVSKCGQYVVNHWAHKTDDCGYESDEHLALKLLFAHPAGAVEVWNAQIRRRADVMLGRSVFEIQRSKIDFDEAKARERNWVGAGYLFTWVIVDGHDVSIPSTNVVHAKIQKDGRVEMWCDRNDRHTFNPFKPEMHPAAMAVHLLTKRVRRRAFDLAEKAEKIAEDETERAKQAAARKLAAEQAARDAVQQAQFAKAEARSARSDIREAARARKVLEDATLELSHRQRDAERRAFAAWVRQRTGARNLTMLRRVARGEPAAAAVIAAIDYRTVEAVRAARRDATPKQVARRLSDLCCVWVGIGVRGTAFCTELATGERSEFDSVDDAALWCVRMIPARAGLEAA